MTGVVGLTRFSLRRSRVLVLVWTAVLVVVAYASAAATDSLYVTTAEQVSAARAINGSPALVALYGPILDEHSLGELAMTKMTVTYAVFGTAMRYWDFFPTGDPDWGCVPVWGFAEVVASTAEPWTSTRGTPEPATSW